MRDQWAKELYVRGEKAADYDTITEINRLAFGREDEANLVNAIRKTKSYEFGFSLVAVKEDVILGHVLFSKGFITHRGRRFKCLVLGPVAVHPEHQRKGIGKALVNEGLERAKEVGFGAVIVVGDPAYYAAFGFKPAVTMKLRTTLGVPDENFMAKEISRNALRGIIGTVMFPREFLTLAEADKKREAEKKSRAENDTLPENSPVPENKPVSDDEPVNEKGILNSAQEPENNQQADQSEQPETKTGELTPSAETITNSEPVSEINTGSGDEPQENNIVM